VGGGPLDTTDGPGVLELVRAAYAIVSKPGGATLWDGLSTATPIIFAPTDAAHERGNADLWCRLGWGVRLEDWQAAGHPAVQLEEIHRNLLQALATVPVYPVAELGPLR
jgi:UDP-N-acetylglucosamine:LPS N-acetylglucosamine transferase